MRHELVVDSGSAASHARGPREALRDLREGLRLFWQKFNDDDAFFLAGGIAWGLLFALVPLLALGIGLTGFVLSARFDDPTQAVVALFAGAMPLALPKIAAGPVISTS